MNSTNIPRTPLEFERRSRRKSHVERERLRKLLQTLPQDSNSSVVRGGSPTSSVDLRKRISMGEERWRAEQSTGSPSPPVGGGTVYRESMETIIHKLRVVGMSRMFMARLEIYLGVVEIEIPLSLLWVVGDWRLVPSVYPSRFIRSCAPSTELCPFRWV